MQAQLNYIVYIISINNHIKAKPQKTHQSINLMGLPFSLWIFTLSLSTISTAIFAATDIPLGSSLSASNKDQSWSSPSKTYSLSFTSISPATSPPSYTASILFSGGVPIWSPGESAAVDSNGALHLDSNGLLRLVNGSGATVWDSGTTGLGVSAASLDDSGNFVLSNSSGTVWSSFENPSDTIVPSQNFTVGKTLRSGDYSFYLQNTGNLTLRWNDSTTYYTKGLNSSVNVSLNSPSIGLQQIGLLSLYDSELKSSVIMAYSSDYAEGGSSRLRFLKLDGDGNLRLYSSDPGSGTSTATWAAMGDQCEVFGFCGNLGVCSYNDTSPICICPSENFEFTDKKNTRKGCKRKISLDNCPNNPTMLELDHTMFFTYDTIHTSNTQTFYIGMTGCRSNCLSSGTSCTASTSLSDGSGLCYLKTPDFISGYQGPSLPSTSFVKICGTPEPNPSGTDAGKGWKLHAWIIVVVVVVTLLGLVGLEFGLWWFFCQNSPKFGTFSAQYALLEYASGAPVQFSYKELQSATKGFKEKLGAGGFGAVYKATLANKTFAAVKQLEGIEQGEKQFRMEVATISSTHHLNLVRLVGFCSEGRHRLLVYEFMKNGSLDSFLFDSEQSGKFLNWEQRFNVALGTAKGITYLHEECRDCIVHCDIKPENILLDENYNAKVSDFGLAKLVNPKDHRYRTLTSVRGTRGYLAPEWLANLPITSKSDVYSYGMVLLETVSGRRNFEVSEGTRHVKFSIWAYEEYEKGNLHAIIDKRLAGPDIDMEQLTRMLQVSFWCIQEQPSHRPMMGKVVRMLEGITDTEKPPAPKGLTEGSVGGTSIVSNVSAFSTFAPSAPAPSSSSSARTLGVSSLASGRNIMERASSSGRDMDRK